MIDFKILLMPASFHFIYKSSKTYILPVCLSKINQNLTIWVLDVTYEYQGYRVIFLVIQFICIRIYMHILSKINNITFFSMLIAILGKMSHYLSIIIH
jgi:hypothetical protein